MDKIGILGIIDDDEIYNYLLKRIVQKVDFIQETLFFENGQIALDYLSEFKSEPEKLPDLILLDINMPVLDGWQFMEEYIKLIPDLNKPIPVYISSSSNDEEDYKRALSIHQVSDYVLKPINEEILQQLVSQI